MIIVKSWVLGRVESSQNFQTFLEIESPATKHVYTTLEYGTVVIMSICLPFPPPNSEPKRSREVWPAFCTALYLK